MPEELHRTVLYHMPILIDEGIVYLVDALNKHNGVQTVYSCQGNMRSDGDRRAYVGFTASRSALFDIIMGLQESNFVAGWQLQIDSSGTHILYVARKVILQMAFAVGPRGWTPDSVHFEAVNDS